MISFTGRQGANGFNSERALLLAVEAANRGGGADGRPFQVLARDTRSDPRKIEAPARELIDAGSAIVIGPDYTDLLAQLRPVLMERTLLLPSFATAADVVDKPPPWFVMGPGLKRVACELLSQARADGRRKILQIVGPSSYNSALSSVLSNQYGLPKHVVSTDQAASITAVSLLTRALVDADAYVLAAAPDTAASLVYALRAIGGLEDPARWYLSPTLHTPGLLETIPKGALDGAHGVSSGNVAGAGEFRTLFTARWHEAPLDDAFTFYDAGAIAALAIQRALVEEHTIPSGSGLARHLVAVTRAEGVTVLWNEIGRGLELLRAGQQVRYFGLSGLQFDNLGTSRNASANWWTIGATGFSDVPHGTDCN